MIVHHTNTDKLYRTSGNKHQNFSVKSFVGKRPSEQVANTGNNTSRRKSNITKIVSAGPQNVEDRLSSRKIPRTSRNSTKLDQS